MKIIPVKLVTALLASISLLVLGLAFWLLNPFDQHAWRVKLPVPLLGVVQLRAYPLLKLATSLPGRTLLDGSHWQNSHGKFLYQNELDGVQVDCEGCNFRIPELSKYPVRLGRLSVSVQHLNQFLSGSVQWQSGATSNQVLYNGYIDMQGLNLNWSLSKTPLQALLQVLRPHSYALQKAHVFGTLAATGSFQLPSRHWTAIPDLQGLEVTGLGTEQLKTTRLNYHCPKPPLSINVKPYLWINEKEMGRWLPKAVLIAEDASFKRHPGYNMDAVRFLLAQKDHSKSLGGSTISQQLAKYLFTGAERTVLRKLEELLYAVEIESTLGKRMILEWYLNTVDWGEGICGAGQAASFYFGRKPAQLSPVQAVWLAGIVRNPHMAMHREYLLQKPDFERLSRIMGFMPKKVRHSPLALKFAKPSGNALSLLLH
jgi:monofunctional glycosyltransferase